MNATSCRIPIPNFPNPVVDSTLSKEQNLQIAVLAGGCFWCVEAVFRELRGVQAVRSGYVGGTKATADYRTVCSGRTDHVEAIEIVYDAALTSFGQLLKIHFSVAHDPTQIDRQGNDVGRQYRSVVFYANEEQQRIAEAYVRELNDAKVFMSPVVTAVEPLKEFFAAEDYHQNYAALNPTQPYIVHVSRPKVEKLREYFGDRLKSAR